MPHADRHDDSMSLGEHLEELRRRLIYALLGLVGGVAVGLLIGRPVLELLKRPYLRVMGDQARLAVFDMTGGFVTYLRVSLMVGILLASPWIFLQLWLFVAAGLYPRERRYVRLAAPFSAGLFLAGAAFFLFVVSEPLLGFFRACNAWLGLESVVLLRNHVRMMTNLMLVFGACFQTPLVIWFLARMGLVTPADLKRYRRHVIVGILILSASVTSPSPVDQLMLAGPMWLLYELGIVLARLGRRDLPGPPDEPSEEPR